MARRKRVVELYTSRTTSELKRHGVGRIVRRMNAEDARKHWFPIEAVERENKLAFAAELIRVGPERAFAAARAVFPDDTGAALWICEHWADDPIVTAQFEKLKSVRDALPTKEQFALDVINQSGKMEDRERVAAWKLFAEIMGFTPKAGVTITNDNSTSNKVLVVRDFGSNADWERHVAEQQRKLTAAV